MLLEWGNREIVSAVFLSSAAHLIITVSPRQFAIEICCTESLLIYFLFSFCFLLNSQILGVLQDLPSLK